ncbi:hypothetical protein V8E53_005366 [Lactarius tabidus]
MHHARLTLWIHSSPPFSPRGFWFAPQDFGWHALTSQAPNVTSMTGSSQLSGALGFIPGKEFGEKVGNLGLQDRDVERLGLKWVQTYITEFGGDLLLASVAFHLRGIGTSLATATNWSINLLIGATYLSLMAHITPSGAFGFYAALCALSYTFLVFCFPETAGLSLEEDADGEAFAHGGG